LEIGQVVPAWNQDAESVIGRCGAGEELNSFSHKVWVEIVCGPAAKVRAWSLIRNDLIPNAGQFGFLEAAPAT
jgi:hypothetical protein